MEKRNLLIIFASGYSMIFRRITLNSNQFHIQQKEIFAVCSLKLKFEILVQVQIFSVNVQKI